MPTNTGDLMEKVYDLFSGIYAATAGDGAFLAFEKLGVPITPGMFKLQPTDTTFSSALAVERLSEIGNAVLEIEGDAVRRSNRTVPAITELMLTQSMPSSSDANAMASLGKAKTTASQAFDVTLGSMDGMFRFHPIYASPVNWYDPTVSDNWTAHTMGKQEGPPPTVAPPPPQRRIRLDRPTWRVVPKDIQPDLSQPNSRTNPIYAALATSEQGAPVRNSTADAAQSSVRRQMFTVGRPAPTIAPQQRKSFPSGFLGKLAMAAGSAIASQPDSTSAASILKNAGIKMIAEATTHVDANTTSRPVSTENIDMSFEHCVVTLHRPWWPEVFLMLKHWFVPGYECAEFSDGSGSEDSGLLPVLTSGFVAIRNLRISSKWSSDDLQAVQGSASFGPFSLVGRTYDAGTGTLTAPGIQIIGWFCEALPILPPDSDPAMAPPEVTSSGPSQDQSPPSAPGPTSPSAGNPSSSPSSGPTSPQASEGSASSSSSSASSTPADPSSSPPVETPSSPPVDNSSGPPADAGTASESTK